MCDRDHEQSHVGQPRHERDIGPHEGLPRSPQAAHRQAAPRERKPGVGPALRAKPAAKAAAPTRAARTAARTAAPWRGCSAGLAATTGRRCPEAPTTLRARPHRPRHLPTQGCAPRPPQTRCRNGPRHNGFVEANGGSAVRRGPPDLRPLQDQQRHRHWSTARAGAPNARRPSAASGGRRHGKTPRHSPTADRAHHQHTPHRRPTERTAVPRRRRPPSPARRLSQNGYRTEATAYTHVYLRMLFLHTLSTRTYTRTCTHTEENTGA